MTVGNTVADQEPSGDYPTSLYATTQRAVPVADFDTIGPAEVSAFQEQGFLAVRSGFDANQVTAGLAGLETLALDPRGADIQFETWAAERLGELDGAARLDGVRKFMHFVGHEDRLTALAHDPRLLAVVRRLCGADDLTLFQDMALLKPPGGGREKPWHQDNAYFKVAPGSGIVGVWIALDEATQENGCMHVIPGSHREGPVIHFRRRDWQICDTDVQTERTVAVPLPPGGVLFFDALLQHGTPANRTDRRRRAVQFHYAPTGIPGISDEDRMAIFGSEGKDVTC